MPEFAYQELLPIAEDQTSYRLLTGDHVAVAKFEGREMLKVDPEGLSFLAREALRDVSFLLRTAHLEQVAAILDDPEASANDRGVALAMLKNAEVSADFVLPLCQDTGTAIIVGKKGQQIWTGNSDEAALSEGVFNAYTKGNLRYSHNAPFSMFEETNTGCNLPAQIELYAVEGDEYQFLFIAKGGGSANKTFLYQETKAVLTPQNLL